MVSEPSIPLSQPYACTADGVTLRFCNLASAGPCPTRTESQNESGRDGPRAREPAEPCFKSGKCGTYCFGGCWSDGGVCGAVALWAASLAASPACWAACPACCAAWPAESAACPAAWPAC